MNDFSSTIVRIIKAS